MRSFDERKLFFIIEFIAATAFMFASGIASWCAFAVGLFWEGMIDLGGMTVFTIIAILCVPHIFTKKENF